PLVELVAGKKTDKKFINKANIFYSNIGMKTLILKKELPGYLSDRLQESMWRESLNIINEGYATTQDLDDAIIYGPGLRWSLMGTFLTFHLAGGKMGMAHMLEQFGPALKLPWTKLKAPKLNQKLRKRIIDGTKIQAKNRSIENLSNLRDNFLIDLQKLLLKYKI
ncbi:MAG: 3-hydroxyacyl-CoA dehydrogenase family protein, partial [Proteobacteria bacterium]|nr:3-hydroxyacyl-CoA dehydrogenase family protein [Pseudomonadota bacterium]